MAWLRVLKAHNVIFISWFLCFPPAWLQARTPWPLQAQRYLYASMRPQDTQQQTSQLHQVPDPFGPNIIFVLLQSWVFAVWCWIHVFFGSWILVFFGSWIHVFFRSWILVFFGSWVLVFFGSWIHVFFGSWIHVFFGSWILVFFGS